MNQRFGYSTSCFGGCLGAILFLILLFFVARTLFWIFGPLLIALVLLFLVRNLLGGESTSSKKSHDDIDPLYDDRQFEEIDSDD